MGIFDKPLTSRSFDRSMATVAWGLFLAYAANELYLLGYAAMLCGLIPFGVVSVMDLWRKRPPTIGDDYSWPAGRLVSLRELPTPGWGTIAICVVLYVALMYMLLA